MRSALFRSSLRPLALGLALSLLIHLFLFGGLGRLFPQMGQDLAFPIEASLSFEAPLPPPRAGPSTRPAASEPKPKPEPAVQSDPPEVPALGDAKADITPAATALPDPVVAEGPSTAPQAGVKPGAESHPVPEAPSSPSSPYSSPSRPVIRSLPEHLELRYAVAVGDDGFVAGEARYVWHARDGRYSLVATVEATGLAALFMHGRITQVSEGELGPLGLRPAQFRQQRKERKQETARFDWGQMRLALGDNAEVVDLLPQAQDLLSFPFHLALTARDDEAPFELGVTNGRRFRVYTFQQVGLETLRLPAGKVSALHLQSRRDNEGTLDVWLETGNSGLPVQIRTRDSKGKVYLLVLRGE